MLNFRQRAIIAGVETMHMIKRGQRDCPDGQAAALVEALGIGYGAWIPTFTPVMSIITATQLTDIDR